MSRPTLTELSTRIDDLDTKLAEVLAAIQARSTRPTSAKVSPKKALYDQRLKLSGEHPELSFWADVEKNCLLFRRKGAYDHPWRVWSEAAQTVLEDPRRTGQVGLAGPKVACEQDGLLDGVTL